MPNSPIDFLLHIRDECEYIESRMGGLSRHTFMQDATLRRAFVRSLEIIGEATKQVPLTIRRKYTSVDWKAMAGMRDRLVHDYFGIDYEIVWDVAQNKIPALKRAIEQIIAQENKR